MYSHLSCLVRLNRTQVRFPPWCRSFGQVWIQESNNCTDTQLKRWSQSGSKWTPVRLNGWPYSTRVVLFTISGTLAKRAAWNRTTPKKKKKSTLYLVQTKASELADYSGVNTPLNIVCWCYYGYHGKFLPITEWKPICGRTRLKELWNQHNIIINNNSAPAINHCERTVKQQKCYREGEILPYSLSEWGWTLENQEHTQEQVPKVFGTGQSTL